MTCGYALNTLNTMLILFLVSKYYIFLKVELLRQKM